MGVIRKRDIMDKNTVRQLIDHYTKEELQELVIYLTDKSETTQQRLLDFCQRKEDVKSDNFSLIIEKQICVHWSKARKILAEFDRYGGGPEWEEDIACEELNKVAELLKNRKVAWTTRRQVLDEMLFFVASDNSGFTDYLVDMAVDMCATVEEKRYLADFLVQKGNSYYQKVAGMIYRECGEDEKFLEYQKAHMEYAGDYVELADYYIQHGDEKQALKLLWEGVQANVSGLSEIYRYMFRYFRERGDDRSLEKLYAKSQKRRNQDVILELMHQYYKEKGDYEHQKETIIKLFSHIEYDDFYKLYNECKEELMAEDFAAEEKSILELIHKRDLSAYFEILMDKKETEEVLAYIVQHPDYGEWNAVDMDHRFSKRLADQYPKEVAEMYWKEVDEFVSRGKEKNYRHAAEVLKEIREIMRKNKWEEQWESRYGEFLRANERKKLLMREVVGM